jgi:hypothetical protein
LSQQRENHRLGHNEEEESSELCWGSL